MTYTKFCAEVDKLAAQGLHDLFRMAGSQAAVAKALKLDRSVVNRWNAVPLIHVRRLCIRYGCSPQDIRPDIFAAPELLTDMVLYGPFKH